MLIVMSVLFTQLYTWAELVALYRLTDPFRKLQPRYKVCLNKLVDVVVSVDGKRALLPMHWGLIFAPQNARWEPLAERPSLKTHRSLVPASGYYDWRDTTEGKQPYYFTRRDGQVMTVAAVRDTWTDSVTNEPVRSFAIMMIEPNKFVAEVHNRMPALLEAKDLEQWEQGDLNDAAALMKPAGEDVLQKWPVSKRVMSSGASDEDATLIQKIDLSELKS
jgi:putative SOS response-associated peptidase YedK